MLTQIARLRLPSAFIEIAKQFADLLKVPVTLTALTRSLEDHPDYPSMLSMSDVLLGYGISNIVIRTSVDKLDQMPLPFIAQVKDRETGRDSLAIVRNIEQDTITWYSPEKRKWSKVSINTFKERWPSGIILLADGEGASGEKSYQQHRREEWRLNVAHTAAFLALPVTVLVSATIKLFTNGWTAILPIVFLLLTLAGTVFSALLLWYELDQYNPMLQKICSSGKKVNCGAILNTKAAKIGGISWSSIGFTYFTGALLLLLFSGITSSQSLFIVGLLNALSIPYVFFSVYYQWKVAKQWCILCLGVQCVLLLQLFTTLAGGWLQPTFNADLLGGIVVAYLLPFMIVSTLMPAYRSAKESKRYRQDLQRLKHNTQIFEALMSKQKSITEDTRGLGIILGNPDARYRLVKVCNPYCGPCAEAHKPIEELLENNPDVQLQIIFAATNATGDKRALPVKHLMAIAEKNDEVLMKQALDDWYLSADKNYDTFAAKYPMNGELKRQDDKIDNMWKWCNKTDISFTPTIFVNGQQLPEIYSVEDLRYFLTV